MKKPINTGLLSFGTSGRLFHFPFLMVHDGFLLTAVVERSVKKIQLQYPDIKSYNAVDELLADPDIELVVINTPNDTHFEFALKALRAGKHVLVEKPFTVNSSQAKQLFQEAKACNRCILPYQNRRYDSDFLSVKDVIDSGRLGKLEEMHLRFDRFRKNIGPKVFQETQIPGSGLLYNLGPHLLDAVISVFGKPLSWTKTLGHFRENTLVDDYAHIHLTYPEELQVYITTGLLIVDPQPAFILHGTKGSYVKQRTDAQEQQLMKGMSPDDPQFGLEEKGKEGILSTIAEDGTLLREKILPARSSYLNVFDRVYQTIRDGKPYPVTEDQIIQQLEILEG